MADKQMTGQITGAEIIRMYKEECGRIMAREQKIHEEATLLSLGPPRAAWENFWCPIRASARVAKTILGLDRK